MLIITHLRVCEDIILVITIIVKRYIGAGHRPPLSLAFPATLPLFFAFPRSSGQFPAAPSLVYSGIAI
jgi:hypothetical protein